MLVENSGSLYIYVYIHHPTAPPQKTTKQKTAQIFLDPVVIENFFK